MEERLGKVDVKVGVFTFDQPLLEKINGGVFVLVTCFGRRKTKRVATSRVSSRAWCSGGVS